MATLAVNFDPIEYTRQLRSVGVSQEQADIQAQAFEQVIQDITKTRNLATKQDLIELKFELIKWMLGIGIGGVFAMAGLLKYVH